MLTLVFAAGICGCANEPPLQSTLDDQGQTWVTADLVVTLARATPRFSAAARDYAYIAPVERNEMGARRHYLWLGLATTVDREWNWAAPTEAVTLVLLLDGQPIALPLAAWDADIATLPQDTPAPVYHTQRASVTLDQLERFANAQSIEMQLVAADGATTSYALWDGAWSDWRAFIAAVVVP
jgi:hypothetical protein